MLTRAEEPLDARVILGNEAVVGVVDGPPVAIAAVVLPLQFALLLKSIQAPIKQLLRERIQVVVPPLLKLEERGRSLPLCDMTHDAEQIVRKACAEVLARSVVWKEAADPLVCRRPYVLQLAARLLTLQECVVL